MEPIARRYAEALFEVAKEHGRIDEVAASLKAFVQILEDTPEVGQFLRSFRVTSSDKVAVIRKVFSGKIADEVLNAISLLLGHRRDDLFIDMLKAYQEIVREDRNILIVEIVTAEPLSSTLKSEIIQALEETLGKTIELSTSVDDSVIGGLKIRIQNKVYDGTIARQLEKLKQQLTKQSLHRG